MHQMDMPMGYHVWGIMLECYQRMGYARKMTNIAELKTASSTIGNDLPQEFTDEKELYMSVIMLHYSIYCKKNNNTTKNNIA